jgi:hypothetical protein
VLSALLMQAIQFKEHLTGRLIIMGWEGTVRTSLLMPIARPLVIQSQIRFVLKALLTLTASGRLWANDDVTS